MLETVHLEPGKDIPHQAANLKAELGSELQDSVSLSPEEAMAEVARLNAEKAIRIVATAAAPQPQPPPKSKSIATSQEAHAVASVPNGLVREEADVATQPATAVASKPQLRSETMLGGSSLEAALVDNQAILRDAVQTVEQQVPAVDREPQLCGAAESQPPIQGSQDPARQMQDPEGQAPIRAAPEGAAVTASNQQLDANQAAPSKTVAADLQIREERADATASHAQFVMTPAKDAGLSDKRRAIEQQLFGVLGASGKSDAATVDFPTSSHVQALQGPSKDARMQGQGPSLMNLIVPVDAPAMPEGLREAPNAQPRALLGRRKRRRENHKEGMGTKDHFSKAPAAAASADHNGQAEMVTPQLI